MDHSVAEQMAKVHAASMEKVHPPAPNDLPPEIPRCAENRTENNATYCVSAYCDRCAELRRRNDEPPLLPNAWMADSGNWSVR